MTARVPPGRREDVGLPVWLLLRLAERRLGRPVPAVFTTLARTRGLFVGWLHFASGLMPRGRLPRRESELVILRVAHVRGSAYEEGHHRRIGRRAGLTPAELERVTGAADDPAWADRDRMLLQVTDDLLATRDLDDARWRELRGHLDEREAIELLLLVGHYDMLATTIGVLRLTPD